MSACIYFWYFSHLLPEKVLEEDLEMRRTQWSLVITYEKGAKTFEERRIWWSKSLLIYHVEKLLRRGGELFPPGIPIRSRFEKRTCRISSSHSERECRVSWSYGEWQPVQDIGAKRALLAQEAGG